MKEAYSLEDLKNFYIERLNSISSKKELEEALREGKMSLELNLDELVPPERREEILRKNPNVINILNKDFQVDYSYSSWDKKFSASIKISASDVLKLTETPVLPSGRKVILEVTDDDEVYVMFFGANLEELKQKSRKFLITKQWNEWYYSDMAPKPKYLENFDPLGELPALPEPIKFGSDPESGDPLFAFPAVTVKSYHYNNEYYIKYFPSKEEAKQAQEEVIEIMRLARAEQQEKEEKERLLILTKELLDKVRNDFNTIKYNYEDCGLSYIDKIDIEDTLYQVSKKIESDPKESLEILQKIDKQIKQAFNYREKRRIAKEKAELAIADYYSICPLCGEPIKDEKCANPKHNVDLIDFEIDEDGYRKSPALLSEIITDKGKIVAQLWVSDGNDMEYYYGDVYLLKSNAITKNAWRGEPFESLEFKDYNRILTLEQAKKRNKRIEEIRKKKELAEAWQRYQEDLEYAKNQVKEGCWKIGRFRKGTHPKTGEEQWELTFKRKGLVVKYIVDRWSRQPTMEGKEYFYSEKRILVNTDRFRLVLVRLEEPFPEDKPKKELNSFKASNQKDTPISGSFTDAIKKLKKKWNAK